MRRLKTPTCHLIPILMLTTTLASGGLAHAAEAPTSSDRQEPPILQAQQAKGQQNVIELTIPKKYHLRHSIVVAWIDPGSGKTTEDVFIMPMGDTGKAISHALKIAKDTGLDNVTTIGNGFANGIFDILVAKTPQGRHGVYAVTLISAKKTGANWGTCMTYFSAADWAQGSGSALHIPIPSAPPTASNSYIPSSCELAIWLVSDAGKRIARTKTAFSLPAEGKVPGTLKGRK